MMFRKIVFVVILVFCVTPVFPSQDKNAPSGSGQQISEFSLAGYGEKGKKSWDLAGKTADIFDENVKLSDVIGNLYGKQEDVKLTAKRGDFNKVNGKVHLEENVVITTSSGTRMTTDTLDWDRRNQLLTTPDVVNITRQNMLTIAKGLKGEPNLKKVSLERNVHMDILSVAEAATDVQVAKEKTVITCDGSLEVDYEKNIATFTTNVKVERPDSTIYSDKMDIYFGATGKAAENKEPAKKEKVKDAKDGAAGFMGNKIDKIVCRGNVKVVRGENVSYSDEAVYNAVDKKLILSGTPKLIIYSTEDLKNASSGN